jgi:aspartyl-tRNA(Asn)/glutamyl-tRNA(Gln) amidotransferase subunit C
MPTRLTREEVLHIADLAKLALTDDEVALYGEQLSDILAHAEVLNRLDTAAIPPTAHVTETRNVYREDVPRESLAPEEALSNAPDRQDDWVRVRAVFE